MPAVGFAELVGEDRMADLARGGRYLCDRALGAFVADLAEGADGQALTYVVTMENHGPWTAAQGPQGALDDYLAHLRSSDAMLSILIDRLAALGRSALLVFFGDHRPSIPGVTQPGGDRHTPYVMLRFGPNGRLVRGTGDPTDLSPAELHHAILRCVRPD
jgi:phosphoglycerol transferase MdoB-like AlkP superfamily enzyme